MTDALVHLGWIRPHRFLGGRMTLLADRAEAALARLTGPLGRSTIELAQAIVDVSAAHVSRGVRLVSVQRGRDPKGYVLYGYGGMGPVVAALVAEELGIRRVVVPPQPGLFSALGLLVADLKREYRETVFLPVTVGAPERIDEVFSRMKEQALEELSRYEAHPEDVRWEHYLEMRYRGQGFELLTPVDLARAKAEGAGYLIDLFQQTHRARYGAAAANEHIEVVNHRLVARVKGPRDVLDRLHQEARRSDGRGVEHGSIHFRGERRACRFAWRESLALEERLDGLAVIEEPTATTVVPPGWRARVDRAGALVLEQGERA